MDPVSRLCTRVIDDLVEMETKLLLDSPLIELALEHPWVEFPLGRIYLLPDSLSAIMFSLFTWEVFCGNCDPT